MKRVTTFFALGFFAPTLFAPTAFAQLSAQEKAVADALFTDGVKLLHAGKWEEACPKLAESERVDPAVGTALYLGECYERTGKLASAQAMFQEAIDLAKRRGDGRAAVAKEHRDKLTPSTLTISLAEGARVPGLEIARDDITLSPQAVGVALPADGGAHVIVARATGKKTYRTTIDVPPKGATMTVTIPVLANEEGPAVVVTPPPPPVTTPWSTRRVIGLSIAGAGVATLVVGAVAGVIATLDWNASNSADNGCDSGSTRCLTQHGIDLRSSAQTWATVSTVGLVAGGVLAVAGAVVFFTAPKARSTIGFTIAPSFFASGAALVAAGAF